ncbi:hypothetical protein NE237_027080 [Protea cynaroides]|uniref:Uncharacterized protein n=1 Tax=Protea cynaroides TaxID=273540 RepID=A0A9Q0GM93_9MAGN|nr:hypothetical protein NE237_027080 [Protea cynaroides]
MRSEIGLILRDDRMHHLLALSKEVKVNFALKGEALTIFWALKFAIEEGLAIALALKRVGIESLVWERSLILRTTGAALSLFPNTWLALQALGVAHKLTSTYSPIQKGYFTNVANGATQEVSFMGINVTSNGSIPVHKRVVLETLTGELTPGTIRFSSKFTSIRTVTINDESSSSIAIISLDDGTIIKAQSWSRKEFRQWTYRLNERNKVWKVFSGRKGLEVWKVISGILEIMDLEMRDLEKGLGDELFIEERGIELWGRVIDQRKEAKLSTVDLLRKFCSNSYSY